MINLFETIHYLLGSENCFETALKIVPNKGVSAEAQTRTNQAKITVLQHIIFFFLNFRDLQNGVNPITIWDELLQQGTSEKHNQMIGVAWVGCRKWLP